MIVPMSQVESKEIAFYYPGPMWHHDDWIKTMILFFDGIGILLPDYLKGKPEREDPAIAIPLREQGLLHILEPEQIVDKAATEKLSAAMTEVINSGVLDKLDKNGEFHEISYSRMGGYGEEQLAKQLLETLKAKGLARDSEDGKSIPMQPMVRSLILVLLSQILRPHGEKLGAELSPATDRPQLVQALQELLSLPDAPSAAHVVAMDLETISVDLRLVPMDEVLGFRKEHFADHRKYIRGVHRLTRDLAPLPVQRARGRARRATGRDPGAIEQDQERESKGMATTGDVRARHDGCVLEVSRSRRHRSIVWCRCCGAWIEGL